MEISDYIGYEPLTGELYWKKSYAFKGAGTQAAPKGTLCFQGKRYPAAKVAWLIKTGSFPPPHTRIYRRNGVDSDLRWENLTDRRPLRVPVPGIRVLIEQGGRTEALPGTYTSYSEAAAALFALDCKGDG